MLADPSQGPLKEKHFGGKQAMLPPDTLGGIIVCLQQAAQAIAVHPEVKEAIVTMMSQAQPFLTRPRQQPPPGQQPQQQQPPPPPGQLRPAGVPPPPPPGQPPPPPPVVTGASGFPPVSLPGGPVRPTPRQALPPAAMAAAALAGGMFPPTGAGADPLISQFGNLGLGGPDKAAAAAAAAAAASSSAFSLPSGLGPLVSGGGASPSRFPSAGAVMPPPQPPTSIEGGSPSPFSGMLPPPPGVTGPPGAAPGLPGLPVSSQAPMPPPPPGVPAATTSAPSGGPGIQSGIEQIRQGNISQIFPEMAGPISREVEDEANRYFQQIYNQPPNPTLTIDEVLELLKKFQVRIHSIKSISESEPNSDR